MRLTNLYEMTVDKSGTDVDLQWELNTEESYSKWTLNRLDAYVGGELAGYLKSTYVDFDRYFTNIFYFAIQQGRNFLPINAEKPEMPWQEWPREWKISALSTYPEMPLWNYRGDKDGLSDEQIDSMMVRAEKILWEMKGKDYKNFRVFHSRPYVDYIRVFKKDEDRGSPRSKDYFENPSPHNYRGRGIALLMYQEAADFYAKRGMRFYASGIQSKEAQAAWEAMRRRGWVKKDRRGVYILPKGKRS